jgi:hypothetical protein
VALASCFRVGGSGCESSTTRVGGGGGGRMSNVVDDGRVREKVVCC